MYLISKKLARGVRKFYITYYFLRIYAAIFFIPTRFLLTLPNIRYVLYQCDGLLDLSRS